MLVLYIFGVVLFSVLQNGFCRTVPNTNGNLVMTKSSCSCPDSSWYYLNETKSCYKVVYPNGLGNMTCDYGRQLCSSLNSTLASIHSAKENIFIAGISLSDGAEGTAYTATGLISEKNTWKWLDGTPLDFTRWYWPDSQGTPKDGFCAYMRTQADPYLSIWFKHEVSNSGFKQAVCKMNANL
jgi:hypothetical protein